MSVEARQIESPTESAVNRLDQSIAEAAAQLIGHDVVYDHPFARFLLLCKARAEFENEAVVGFDPELQWAQIARDAYVDAGAGKEGHYPLPRRLSEVSSAEDWQREVYQKVVSNLVIANTDETPEVHYGIDFAGDVADGVIQIRYV